LPRAAARSAAFAPRATAPRWARARETLACVRTAEAFGYVEPVSRELLGEMNRVIGTLVRVAA